MDKPKQPFQVGDQVTLAFPHPFMDSGPVNALRTVTLVFWAGYHDLRLPFFADDWPIKRCESGWRVSVAALPPCPACGHALGCTLEDHDSGWFRLAEAA
jgi:hypothetical protein